MFIVSLGVQPKACLLLSKIELSEVRAELPLSILLRGSQLVVSHVTLTASGELCGVRTVSRPSPTCSCCLVVMTLKSFHSALLKRELPQGREILLN